MTEYDRHKEEVLRYLCRGPEVMEACRKFISALGCPTVPAVKLSGLNESHHETSENFVMTMAGSADVIDNAQYFGDTLTRRTRIQRRWLVRKLKHYGEIIGSQVTRVSSCNGTVYFSYHLIMPQASHLEE